MEGKKALKSLPSASLKSWKVRINLQQAEIPGEIIQNGGNSRKKGLHI